MKKKTGFIIGGVVIVAAIAVMLIFALGGKDGGTTPAALDLEGTWKVVVSVSGGQAAIVDNETMVFTADTATDYRDGAQYMTSSYKMNGDIIEFPDVNKKYTVEKKTDEYVRLMSDGDYYNRLDIVKYNEANENADAAPYEFNGKYSIAFRNSEADYSGAFMVFADGKMSYYYTSPDKADKETAFEVNAEDDLIITDWNMDLNIYPLADGTVILIENAPQAGDVWVLKPAV